VIQFRVWSVKYATEQLPSQLTVLYWNCCSDNKIVFRYGWFGVWGNISRCCTFAYRYGCKIFENKNPLWTTGLQILESVLWISLYMYFVRVKKKYCLYNDVFFLFSWNNFSGCKIAPIFSDNLSKDRRLARDGTLEGAFFSKFRLLLKRFEFWSKIENDPFFLKVLQIYWNFHASLKRVKLA